MRVIGGQRRGAVADGAQHARVQRARRRAVHRELVLALVGRARKGEREARLAGRAHLAQAGERRGAVRLVLFPILQDALEQVEREHALLLPPEDVVALLHVQHVEWRERRAGNVRLLVGVAADAIHLHIPGSRLVVRQHLVRRIYCLEAVDDDRLVGFHLVRMQN